VITVLVVFAAFSQRVTCVYWSISATFYDFFRNADSVRVVSSSSGPGQSQPSKYISCIIEAKFFINDAIKSANLLAHAVFTNHHC